MRSRRNKREPTLTTTSVSPWRDSSLSASCQAVMAAEVGYLELATTTWPEAALMDLDDSRTQHPRRSAHCLVGRNMDRVGAGLGACRECQESLNFAPRLPAGIARLSINLVFQGRRLRVETTAQSTSLHPKGGRRSRAVPLWKVSCLDCDASRRP